MGCIDLNADTQTITNATSLIGNDWHSAFGGLKCEYPNIYQWKLRIDAERGNQKNNDWCCSL